MKYFFLSEGWGVGRVWEFGGLWNEMSWRRKPEIQQTNLCILENGERLWLYSVEDAVIMLEVRPVDPALSSPASRSIGSVVLKRLITGEQAIELLCKAESCFNKTDGCG
ncbi:MAG: hypothetical protein HC827_01325 [Cyanobacteria bacterium RM1_2_2]|nr:hypothetical protein [Cyanobacteria bacterium RM1_2_2]